LWDRRDVPEFPLPSFGPFVEDILDHAVHIFDLLDEKRFLWVILAFYLVVYVARWAIEHVHRPPQLK
jgi:hypothetical protein